VNGLDPDGRELDGRDPEGRDDVEVDGTPAVTEGFHPLSIVYGGGGVFGIGYSAGVARGLEDGGIPVSTAPALGTSAGSWTAAAVALGLAYEDVASLEAPSVPNLRPGLLAGIARQAFGEATHPLVSVSAVCLTSGRRHILDGGVYPLADLVAASSAVPGLLAPHRVGGNLYVDGGMWSTTSVDAARHARSVIVIAPLAGPHVGWIGRGAGLLLERELRGWRRRYPDRRIVMIRPERAMGRFVGRTPLSLFDAGRARAVYPMAYEQGRRWAERLLRPDGS
jgi:predicted acylesterase/phospholipase RssA